MERRMVTLTRDVTNRGPYGTYGYLWTGSYACVTIERPFSGDHPCIPPGDYDVDWTDDGRHPEHNPCYEVMNVPGRTAILIHLANWYQELLGCIAPGTRIQTVQGNWGGYALNQKGVSGSKEALANLLDDLDRQSFRLVIVEK